MDITEGEKSIPNVVTLMSRYRVMILSYAQMVTGDVLLAEDAFQEVCLIMTAKPEAIPLNSAIIPWLREVTRRKSLELLRKAQRVPLLSDDIIDQMEQEIESDEREDLEEIKRAIAACLKDLPDDARYAIQQRYTAAAECEDIGDKIGRSVQGVYALLKRSRAKLQQCVERKVPNAAGHQS